MLRYRGSKVLALLCFLFVLSEAQVNPPPLRARRVYTDSISSNVTASPVLILDNLIFPDATYDIGASGATRPRNLFLSGTATLGSPLLTTSGGTGLSSWTAGDVPYYASGTTLSKLAVGGANKVLGLNSGNTAPEYKAVTITTAGAVDVPAGLTLSGTASNITVGSNYISRDGTDAGLSFDASNNATLSANLTMPAGNLSANKNIYQHSIGYNNSVGQSFTMALGANLRTSYASTFVLGLANVVDTVFWGKVFAVKNIPLVVMNRFDTNQYGSANIGVMHEHTQDSSGWIMSAQKMTAGWKTGYTNLNFDNFFAMAEGNTTFGYSNYRRWLYVEGNDGDIHFQNSTTNATTKPLGNTYIDNGNFNIASLTASRLVASDASKNLVSTITLANLASSISDVTGTTGTGKLVLDGTPTLVTPNIGAATGTSVNLTGAGTFGGIATINGGQVFVNHATAPVVALRKTAATAVGYDIIISSDNFGIDESGVARRLTIAKTTGLVTLANDLSVSGSVTAGGDVAVNGGDITSTQTTFNLLDVTPTTINFGGAATTMTIGAPTGTTTVDNDLAVSDQISSINAVATQGNFGVPAIVDTVVNGASSSSIGATNIVGTTVAGFYRVNVYVEVGTADAADNVAVALTWSNGGFTRTVIAALTLAAGANNSISVPIYHSAASSSAIQYATTYVNGGGGTGTYTIHVEAERMN